MGELNEPMRAGLHEASDPILRSYKKPSVLRHLQFLILPSSLILVTPSSFQWRSPVETLLERKSPSSTTPLSKAGLANDAGNDTRFVPIYHRCSPIITPHTVVYLFSPSRVLSRQRCSPGSSHLVCHGCEMSSMSCRGYRPPTCEECYRNKKVRCVHWEYNPSSKSHLSMRSHLTSYVLVIPLQKCVYDGEGSCRACTDNGASCQPRDRFSANFPQKDFLDSQTYEV